MWAKNLEGDLKPVYVTVGELEMSSAVMNNIPFLVDEERDGDGLNSPKSVSTKTCWEPNSPLG